MDRHDRLTSLQVELAHIFFSLDVGADYVVAGGAALLASDLISPSTPHRSTGRPTPSLDPH